jgi:surfeit locus 1 family protein
MLLLHLVAVVGILGTAWLGWWQVGAWQDHRHDKADALANKAALPLDKVLGPDDAFPAEYVGQPVTLHGTWTAPTVYVEKGDGYWVVTPVSTGTGSAILVVRGSTTKPESPTLHGETGVTGWLQPGESSSAPDTDESDDVFPDLRIADVLERMDQDLYGGYVIAKEPHEPGLAPVTPDQLPRPSAFTSLRNLLYGIEWWVFGGFAVFLWWRWCRDEVDRVRSVSTAGELADTFETATASPPQEPPEVPSTA